MKRSLLLACGVVALLASSRAHADVKVPSVFASHMVIQRDKPVIVWGWADKDEAVSVSFGGKEATTKADDKGNWKVELPKFAANARGQKMTIKGNNSLELDDVLIGDVWLGSGQSNMEWSLASSANPKETIEAAKHPNIRLLHVKRIQTQAPAKDVQLTSAWSPCTPEKARNFSAVLYHFGVRLHKDLDVPIGLINSSWGGSAIQPWTPDEKNPKGAGMYNAMIAPMQPIALKGVIWYQGESNMGEGMRYRDRKEALITAWRRTFGQELPFYFVQIAPYTYGNPNLAELWEAQCACLKIANTGMAVTTDLVDNVKDIHPKNKFDVGNRLALWALAKTYGKKDLVYSGPLYKGMKIDGGKIRLSFAHVGGGLKSRDGKALTEFEIAGEDGKFVAADATVEGNEVVVQAKDLEKPTQVRFGWRNVANPNLSNKEGLPASPFRTKDWRGGTGE